MKSLRAILLTGLALSAASAPAYACSCRRGADMPLPPVIVQAQVLDVRTNGPRKVARLRVLGVERGRAPRLVHVTTAPHSAACGISFQTGATMRLGMTPAGGGQFSANLCQQLALGRGRP